MTAAVTGLLKGVAGLLQEAVDELIELVSVRRKVTVTVPLVFSYRTGTFSKCGYFILTS
jgi:hypothetical protein